MATPTWWRMGAAPSARARMMAAGGALVGAAEKVIARGKQIAAHLLEAAEVDMEFADGVFRVAGTDRGHRHRGGGEGQLCAGRAAGWARTSASPARW